MITVDDKNCTQDWTKKDIDLDSIKFKVDQKVEPVTETKTIKKTEPTIKQKTPSKKETKPKKSKKQ